MLGGLLAEGRLRGDRNGLMAASDVWMDANFLIFL